MESLVLELLFSILFDYVFFNIGRAIIIIVTLGRIRPTLDDKPIDSNLVAILGLGCVVTLAYPIFI